MTIPEEIQKIPHPGGENLEPIGQRKSRESGDSEKSEFVRKFYKKYKISNGYIHIFIYS